MTPALGMPLDAQENMTISIASTPRESSASAPAPPDLPRVLVVAASPRYVGGQSVMGARLVEDLARDGVQVGFVPVDPQLPRLLQPLDRVKFVRTLLRSTFYIASLLREVRKYDVVHVFSASYWSFLVSPTPALLVARFYGKPAILNYHSGEADDHLARSGRVTKALLRSASAIVVPSGYLVEVFAKYGFTASVVPNHLDASLIPYHIREAAQPRILVARTLEPLYNIACALRAFAIVQKKHPQATLTVLGDGSQRSYLAELARELGLQHVEFAGRVERAQIADYYDRADVFLNTSSIDNMPVSIIEAFAAGLPVVTTDAGGIPFMVRDRDNGHLAPIDDHETLAARLLELVERPDEVRRLSERSRESFRSYTWETAGPQWKNCYSRLCQPRVAVRA